MENIMFNITIANPPKQNEVVKVTPACRYLNLSLTNKTIVGNSYNSLGNNETSSDHARMRNPESHGITVGIDRTETGDFVIHFIEKY
jgi:hypothetical protein